MSRCGFRKPILLCIKPFAKGIEGVGDPVRSVAVAMAGLDPRQATSGSSVQRKPRLSKAGNRRLRLALFMPALTAIRHDIHVNAYYRHLITTRGLKKIQAVCAVMRKLLHAIHGMFKTRQPFDGQRFYALPVEA